MMYLFQFIQVFFSPHIDVWKHI